VKTEKRGEKIITYIEFGSDGHRPVWIRSIMDAFKKAAGEWRLNIWVPKEFIEIHKKWCAPYIGPGKKSDNIAFRFYEDMLSPSETSRLSPFNVAQKCVQADTADVCFLANNLDVCVKEIAFSRPGAIKAKLVGVLDQPFLHYSKFSSSVTKKWLSPKRYLFAYIKTFLMCHRSFVERVLMLDPLAPSFYNRILATSKCRFLPEYVTEVDLISDPRGYFGLPEHRKIFLLTGAISRYKGVIEFLNALREALKYSGLKDQACIVIAGKVVSDVRRDVYNLVSDIQTQYPEAPIFLIDRLLTDEEFVSLISSSDVVCLPYGKVPTTSGLLMHAAACGKPVFAYDFGIVGELVRKHHLGVLYNRPDPEVMATALRKSMNELGSFGPERIKSFQNFTALYSVSLKRFGEEVCTSLLRVGNKDF